MKVRLWLGLWRSRHVVVTSGSWVEMLEDRTQKPSRALYKALEWVWEEPGASQRVTHREAEGSGGRWGSRHR